MSGGDPAPVVVVLHGGFWRQEFDRRHTRPMAQALAAEGYVVATPEYRRTGGDGGWPQTFDDVAAALTTLPLLADILPGRAQLDVAPKLIGHSAGGHLGMWAALRPRAHRVGKVVALAPVADLARAHAHALGEGAVAALMGGAPSELPEAYAAADPARWLPPPADAPPITVVHGDQDDRVPVDMSHALAGVDLVELRGIEHFGLIDPLSPAWPHVLAAVHD